MRIQVHNPDLPDPCLSSIIHRVARFPTVVGCAGWKWVNARVGCALYLSANLASSSRTLISFLLYQLQGFCHNDDIGVVSYVAGGCTQMDDSFCFRTLYTVRIHMGHNIVAHQFLTLFSHIIIDIIFMCFQFIDLLLL